MIGTLFLWIFWPSFNFAVAAHNNFEQTLIVTNTLISLTGSCLATFFTCTQLSKKLSMTDILNATLAGGVAVGASSGVTYYPSVALSIGIIAGTVSTLGFHLLTPFLERKIGLYDTCGIHNLHGIPGLLGGICSAIVIGSYHSGFDTLYTNNFARGTSLFVNVSDFLHQGGMQVLGTLTSLGLGLAFGLITGFVLMKFDYS
jgi:ammonium transporter Rh